MVKEGEKEANSISGCWLVPAMVDIMLTIFQEAVIESFTLYLRHA